MRRDANPVGIAGLLGPNGSGSEPSHPSLSEALSGNRGLLGDPVTDVIPEEATYELVPDVESTSRWYRCWGILGASMSPAFERKRLLACFLLFLTDAEVFGMPFPVDVMAGVAVDEYGEVE